MISIDQTYLSLKKDIELIEKDYVKLNGGTSTRLLITIYLQILMTSHHIFSNSINRIQVFNGFMKRYKEYYQKQISLKGGLYSYVVMIWYSILKTNVAKEDLVKDKYQNNESEINTQNEDINNMDSDLVKYKDKTRLSEATGETKKQTQKNQRKRINNKDSL